MRKYWVIWWRTALASVQSSLVYRWGAGFFLAGKLLRFGLFLVFLRTLHQQLDGLAGYDFDQLVTFFLMFNWFDLVGQILFRGIYWFRNKVVSGEFDFYLAKPVNSLFQVLTGHTDILDLPLLVIVMVMLGHQGAHLSAGQWLVWGVISGAGLMFILAVHILVAALGILTTEVDHTIMIYRDVSQMARWPIDIYADNIRALLTFVIPVTLAFSLPAKAWLGLTSWTTAIWAVGGAGIVLGLGLKLWRYALTQYVSASS